MLQQELGRDVIPREFTMLAAVGAGAMSVSRTHGSILSEFLRFCKISPLVVARMKVILRKPAKAHARCSWNGCREDPAQWCSTSCSCRTATHIASTRPRKFWHNLRACFSWNASTSRS